MLDTQQCETGKQDSLKKFPSKLSQIRRLCCEGDSQIILHIHMTVLKIPTPFLYKLKADMKTHMLLTFETYYKAELIEAARDPA